MKIAKKLALMLKSMLSIRLGSVETDKAVLFWDAEVEQTAEEPQEEIQQEENTPDENQEEIKQEENPEVDPADNADDQEEEKPLEDRVAGIEERIAAIMDGLNQFINSIAALEERLAVVEDKLAKVEEPAADPVDEQPEVQQSKNILNYLRKK